MIQLFVLYCTIEEHDMKQSEHIEKIKKEDNKCPRASPRKTKREPC